MDFSSPASLREKTVPKSENVNQASTDLEFGGTEARKAIEKKLLWKLDVRMSVLVVIYILNYVSALCKCLKSHS